MQIRNAIKRAASQIKSDSSQLDAQLLLLHVIEAPRTILFTDPDRLLSEEQIIKFETLLARRIEGEPIAYLLGSQGFWTLDLEVSTSTLIPRPETESLIEWVINHYDSAPKHALDLGTGTGVIALALAKERPSWTVTGVDVKREAVELAIRNAKRNTIQNALFFESNWFSAVPSSKPFDLIISNPPYIDEQDIHLEQGDVRFEPRSALVSLDNGLADIKKIVAAAKSFLKGYLVIEHGWQQAKSVREIMLAEGYEDVTSKKDLLSYERFSLGKIVS